MNRFILHIAAIDNRKKLKYATIFNAVMIFKCQFTFKKSLSGRSKGTLIGGVRVENEGKMFYFSYVITRAGCGKKFLGLLRHIVFNKGTVDPPSYIMTE